MLSKFFLIGADIVPTESNLELFMNGNIEELIGKELKRLFYEADFRIFNLEVPLTDINNPILKWGPNLIAPVKSINGYKALDINLLALANNHILDQGETGLHSTIQILNNVNINHIGAGENLSFASKPFIFNFNEKKIGVYACAEHEFSIAEDNKAGANPFDPLWSFDHVFELKNKTDFVIVLYHGGKEHYRYPSPNLQKVCRRFIDKGANLVICQHSHCIGCEEKYAGGTIVYGQGNFLFDHSNNECWQTGVLIKVDSDFSVSYIPVVKSRNVVRMAEKNKSLEILNDFRLRSNLIQSNDFLQNEYNKYSESNFSRYFYALRGKNLFMFRLLKKIGGKKFENFYLHRIIKNKKNIQIANYLDCECHREIISNILKKSYIKE